MAKKEKAIKREKRLGFNWFFWLSVVAIAIPVYFFVNLLLQASEESNVPINGSRLQDTVVYEINAEQIATVNSALATIENVEKVNANLTVQTFRVSVDVADTVNAEGMKTIAKQIYEKIDEAIPVATYFTRVDNAKEYDLEITLYDNLDNEEPVIVSLTRNAAMEEEGEQYLVQVISSPVNQKLTEKVLQTAKELEEELAAQQAAENQKNDENPEENPDGNQDVQDNAGTNE